MSKVIVVLSEARTGSNLVMDALNSYDPILNLYEFYPREDIDFAKEVNYTNASNAVKSMSELAVKDVTSCMKIQSYQLLNLPSDDIDKILSLPHVEIILLERIKLSSYVSGLQAKKTLQYHLWNTDEVMIKFDAEEFLNFYIQSSQFYMSIRKKLQDLNKNYLEMSYERDLEEFSYDKFHALIDPWLVSTGITLGKKTHKLTFSKQRTVPIEQCISNYNDCKNIINWFKNKL